MNTISDETRECIWDFYKRSAGLYTIDTVRSVILQVYGVPRKELEALVLDCVDRDRILRSLSDERKKVLIKDCALRLDRTV